jgi:hypothetical protein
LNGNDDSDFREYEVIVGFKVRWSKHNLDKLPDFIFTKVKQYISEDIDRFEIKKIKRKPRPVVTEET